MKKHSIFKKAAAGMLGAVVFFGTAANVGNLSAGAEETANQVTYKCVMMNVPYTDFYAAYGLTDQAVWDVNKTEGQTADALKTETKTGTKTETKTNALDAVTTATTKNFLDTKVLARGTYNDGKHILGVKLPVAVSETDYRQLTTGLKDTQDYYFEDMKEVPAAYSALTVANGKYSFSKLPDAKKDVSRLSIADLVMTGKYGDYQISLNGVGTDGKLATGEAYTIYGAILSIDDKYYGMTCLENLWYGTKMPDVAIAWSVKNGNQKVNAGGKLFYQFDQNGGELKGVQLLTNLGILNIPCATSLSAYYPGTTAGLRISLENGSDTLKISGIPADLKNPRVSVSYEDERRTVMLADRLQVKEGEVVLKEKAKKGVLYDIEISSDNYVSLYKNISVLITEEQKAKVLLMIDKAKKTTNYDSNEELKKAVAEAENFIKDTKASSVEAEMLCETLLKKIKTTYSALTIDSLTLKDSVLVIGLKESLSAIGKAEYTLTFTEGNEKKVLESGELKNLSFKLKNAPTAGTEYTLTIVSENYQDTTKRVTAEVTLVTPAPTAVPQALASPEATAFPTGAPVATSVPAASAKPVQTPEPSVNPAATPVPQKAMITVKTTSKDLSEAKLKKKAITFSIGASVNSKGALSYSKVSGSKKLTVNAQTGKITVKKKTSAGIYTIKVKISAAANGNYKAAKLTKMIVVHVD